MEPPLPAAPEKAKAQLGRSRPTCSERSYTASTAVGSGAEPQSAAAPGHARAHAAADTALLLPPHVRCRRGAAAQQRQGRAQCRSLRRQAQQQIRCSARRPSCPSCSRATNASRGACEPGAQVPGQPRSGGRRAPRQHLRRLRFGQPRHSLPLPRGSVRPRRDITWRDESLSRLPAVL